jgi:hypothetical protein
MQSRFIPIFGIVDDPNTFETASKGRTAEPPKLESNQGARHPCAGTIEKKTHAECFCPLDSYQTEVPAPVIRMLKCGNPVFIRGRIPFEPRNPLLHGLPEAGADVEGFTCRGAVVHFGLLIRKVPFLRQIRLEPHLEYR